MEIISFLKVLYHSLKEYFNEVKLKLWWNGEAKRKREVARREVFQ